MARPERNLVDGETLVLRLRPHGRVLLWPFLVLLMVATTTGALIGAVRGQPAQDQIDALLLGIAATVVLWWVLRPFVIWWMTDYLLTDGQVLLRQGVLRRTGRHLPLNRIDSLSVDRDVIDRLLGCGRLTLHPTGDTDPLVLLDVPQVKAVEQVLTAVLDAHAAGELAQDDEDDEDWDDYQTDLDDDGYGAADQDDEADGPDQWWGADDEDEPGARPARRRWRR
jgi:uncharacterized membrane protein YdbT with pleckstrin-like domain